MFSLKSPSLLALIRNASRAIYRRSTALRMLHVTRIMRELIDPVFPEALRPMFQGVFRQLRRGKALGTDVVPEWGLFACPRWHRVFFLQGQFTVRRVCKRSTAPGPSPIITKCWVQRYPSDLREVIPFMPEPIVKQDGTTKNDCERNAPNASWSSCVRTTPISTSLSLKTVSVPMLPTSRTLHDHGCHYILGSKKAIMPISSHRCRPLRKPGA